jgi:site-specific DNA-methyltransferase (adenine-specific)
VIFSRRTPRREKAIAPHPSLKPQAFLRTLARAALPMGEGVVLDPFAGSGSTLAACEAVQVKAIGIESDMEYVRMAAEAILPLAAIPDEQDDYRRARGPAAAVQARSDGDWLTAR